ncbi:MAG: hypothetical protein ACE5E9_04920 [Nitrospinaceae bacterium]
MARRWIKGLMIATVVLVMTGPAFSFTQFFSSKPEKPVSLPPLPVMEEKNIPMVIGSSDKGVRINVSNGYLVDVLQKVADETNVSFRVADSLLTRKITANIREADWEAGVHELLKDVSTVALWDKNSRLRDVVLLNTSGFAAPAGRKGTDKAGRPANQTAPASMPRPGNAGTAADASQKIARAAPEADLSIFKIKRLLQIQPGTVLPRDLFEDPDLKPFFDSGGIRSPEDWKEFNKARKARVAARGELRKKLSY